MPQYLANQDLYHALLDLRRGLHLLLDQLDSHKNLAGPRKSHARWMTTSERSSQPSACRASHSGGNGLSASLGPPGRKPIATRDVTGYRAFMPGPLPKNGVRALSVAERAAAYRARRKAELEAAGKAPVVRIRYRKPQDKRSRPQRWRDAVAELVDLQADYAAWLDALPASLRDSATADALRAICDFDLSELEALEPPRGFGRD